MDQPPTLTADGKRASAVGPLRLVVLDGATEGAFLDLTEGTYRIGKNPLCDLALPDPLVSRDHLLVHVTRQGVHVRDLGSKNGSLLGGVRLVEGVLCAGAVLQLGNTRLRLVSTLGAQPRPPSRNSSFGGLYGASLVMRELFALLEAVAPTETNVLIEAETGAGKELCALAIHAHSGRSQGPYVVCDLAGATRSLLESELFGHVRGAFTGADRAHAGCFVEADGGTLFLDELGELDLDLQPRLLRAIESREVKPVGGSAYRPVDIRIIAATNRNLEEEVRAGRFREDLFFRLAVVRVCLPPLRQRKEDVPGLARIFVGNDEIEIPPETQALLSEYDWPGNVRELKNVMARGLAHAVPGSKRIEPYDLGLAGTGAQPGLPWPVPNDKRSLLEVRNQLIDAWEKHYLEELMERCGGNVSLAARNGGIGREYLHRLLKRHGLGRWAR